MSQEQKKSIRCPSCGASYRIDPSKIPSEGARLTCPSCNQKWLVREREPGPEKATERASGGDAAECPQCGHLFVPARRVRTRRVLVVDDQAFFRNFAVETLSGSYTVFVAKTTDEAVRSALEHKPDLIVLDLGLEGGADDGKRVLERLEGRFPVVILTGRTDFDLYGNDWRELAALGARELVIKGFSMDDELKLKVERVLG